MPVGSPSIVHTGKDGAFVSEAAKSAVDQMFADDLAGSEKIVLYFHGGLDDAAEGLKIAQNLDPVFKNAGAHPVFFVWESGLIEILTHNIAEIAGEDFFKIVLKTVLKFASAKITEVSGGRAPDGTLPLPDDMQVYTELAKRDAGVEPYRGLGEKVAVSDLSPAEEFSFKEFLAHSPDFSETVDAIVASILPTEAVSNSRGVEVRKRKAARTLMSPEVVEELRADAEQASANGARGILTGAVLVKRAVTVLARVIRRFQDGRAHGLYPTVVEELLREFYAANIGLRIWGAMKGETQDTFQPSEEERGGRYFVEKLGELLKQGHRPQITLVGHSTGAVFIGNLLSHAQSMRLSGNLPSDFAFKHIVLLAPASRVSEFQQYVADPYFGGHGALYETIRIFGMTDETECKDVLVPYVYTRSLLYFVSGILEPGNDGQSAADVPLIGMQRCFIGNAKYTAEESSAIQIIKNVINAVGDRSVWAPCVGGPGLSSQSKRHGDFDDDPVTRESMSYLIGNA